MIDVLPAPGQTDHLRVTDTADLSVGLVVQPVGPPSLKPGTSIVDIVTATGSSKDDVLHVLSVTPVIAYDIAQPDSNDLALDITVNFIATRAFTADGLLSQDRRSIGCVLDEIEEDGPPAFLAPVGDAIAALQTAQALAGTYDSLLGRKVVDVQQVSFAAQQSSESRALRQIGTGSASAGSYGAVPPDPAVGARSGRSQSRAWTSGFDGNDLLEDDGRTSLEDWFDDRTMAGISVFGSNSHFAVSGQTDNGHDQSVDFGLFGRAWPDPFYALGLPACGDFASSEMRTGIGTLIGFDSAALSSFDENTFGGRIEVGLRPGASIDFGGHVLAPGLQIGWIHEIGPERMLVASLAAARRRHALADANRVAARFLYRPFPQHRDRL